MKNSKQSQPKSMGMKPDKKMAKTMGITKGMTGPKYKAKPMTKC